MYEIRDDIPIPDTITHSSKYNFDLLKIGSSFAVPSKERKSLCSSANQHKRRHPETFNYMIRLVIEDGEKVTRIWRIVVEDKKQDKKVYNSEIESKLESLPETPESKPRTKYWQKKKPGTKTHAR